MQKILIIASHFMSGSTLLRQSLESHARIEGCNILPTSIPDILEAASMKHKCRNASAIRLMESLTNESFAAPAAYDFCKFVFLLREPKGAINDMIAAKTFPTQERACDYYLFRLRRLCEMAKRAKEGILLGWSDVESGKCWKPLEGFIDLKEALAPALYERFEGVDLISSSVLEEAQKGYENYLGYLRNLKLSSC